MKIGEWIEIEKPFLTNKPVNSPMPRGCAWEYYLWARRCRKYRAKIMGRIRTWVVRRKYIHTLSAASRGSANTELQRFIARKDVRVV